MKHHSYSINANSMADIAFLLLTFFLISTSLDIPEGIAQKLPDINDQQSIKQKDRNILSIHINHKGEVRIEDILMPKNQIKNTIIDFIDNGGGVNDIQENCHYCSGKKNDQWSEHPQKAIVELKCDSSTPYENYIEMMDLIHQAYSELRNTYALKHYGTSYTQLKSEFQKTKNPSQALYNSITDVENKYPKIVVESTLENL